MKLELQSLLRDEKGNAGIDENGQFIYETISTFTESDDIKEQISHIGRYGMPQMTSGNTSIDSGSSFLDLLNDVGYNLNDNPSAKSVYNSYYQNGLSKIYGENGIPLIIALRALYNKPPAIPRRQ